MKEKPMILVREDLTREIAEMINRSKLPLIVVEPVLEKLLTQTRVLIQREYEKEKADYETEKNDGEADEE